MERIFPFAGENILFLPGYKLKKARVSQLLDPGFAKTRPGYFFISPQEHFPFKDLKHTFKDLKHTFKVFERKIARGSGQFSPGKAEKKALTEFNYCK